MAEFNRYWAEEELGEPYAPQDYSWMIATRRAGMLLGGATCVLTTSALLGAAVYHFVDPTPRVSISSYETEMTTTLPAMIRPSEALGSARSNKAPDLAPAPAGAALITVAAPQKPAVTHSEVVAPTAAPRQARPVMTGPAPDRTRPLPAATSDMRQLIKPQVATVAPESATAPDRPILTTAAAMDGRLQATLPDAAPPAKTQPDTRIGLSKAAESKPADIASGEKLGIREILPDGIVMQNGRRVKNGSQLPNGEILIGTDAAKGMAETDRRVMVVTP